MKSLNHQDIRDTGGPSAPTPFVRPAMGRDGTIQQQQGIMPGRMLIDDFAVSALTILGDPTLTFEQIAAAAYSIAAACVRERARLFSPEEDGDNGTSKG